MSALEHTPRPYALGASRPISAVRDHGLSRIGRPTSPTDVYIPLSPSDVEEYPLYLTEDRVGVVHGEQMEAARLLVADVYEKHKYITPDQRTPEGFINEEVDPHVEDSTYFARMDPDGKVKATARLIAKNDVGDFPALAEFNIPSDKLNRICDDPSKYREVSALAKNPDRNIGRKEDVLSVYADMMRETINSGGQYWLMSADAKFSRVLRQLFGSKSFQVLGETKHYMGSDTTPMLMDIHKALHLFKRSFVPEWVKRPFRDGLKGIDTTKLDRKTLKVLAGEGIIDRQEIPPYKPTFKTLAQAGLYTYVLSRAGVIPASSLDQHGVNTFAFLLLDAVTVKPYVEGLSMMNDKSSSKQRRIGGGVLAVVSFAAPYAYTIAATNDYSELPKAAAMFVGIAGTVSIGKKIYEKNKVRIDRIADKMVGAMSLRRSAKVDSNIDESKTSDGIDSKQLI